MKLTNYCNLLGVLALAATFGACSSGSDGSGGGETGSLAIDNISVPSNAQWQINRPVAITFGGEVDFSTVSLNTIQLFEQGGVPVVGEFSFAVDANGVARRNVIEFQPRCPQNADLSDAGFQPGGRQYTLNIVGSETGSGTTVRSVGGAPVRSGRTVNFNTPNSTDFSVLFLDQRPGSPAGIVVRADDKDARTDSTHIRLAGDDSSREYFTAPPAAATDADITGALTSSDFRAPLNLYSSLQSRMDIVVAIDQAVDPSEDNISPTRVPLEYLESGTAVSGTWLPVDSQVRLESNCAGTGALLVVSPRGVLPQGRTVRLRFTEEFRDLSGERYLLPQTLLSFIVDTATNPGTTDAGDTADEYREEFLVGGTTVGSNQDVTTASDAAPAAWGQGELSAGFAFGGSGGPGGAFDWTVEAPTGSTIVNFDTSFQQITNTDQSITQTILGGVVDVRNLTVPANVTLRVLGPNPLIIRATGDVVVAGKIDISGSSNRGVVTFSSTNIPEQGASGNGGGGRGGIGSILTTQSTPAGEDGYGPFNTPGQGGGGGDSGWSTTTTENTRRGAGGGGGAFGRDTLLANGICPDQTIIGLDAEPGASGGPGGNSAVLGIGVRARGGRIGARPFTDSSATNDFFGTVVTASGPLRGELGSPWAGSGGGGGGDSSQVGANGSWPPPFTPTGDEKGSGGGGGGGQLIIYCLGDVRFVGTGLIQSNGGTGGGGENTSGINRVGGGSGAGSGGHIIIQSAGQIDFSGLTSNNGGLRARGGQGGEGGGGLGGAGPYGTETGANQDLLIHGSVEERRAYGTTPPCAVTGNASTQFGTFFDAGCQCLVGTGGDGGPGLIQLHVNSLADIVPPGGAVSLSQCIRPPAVGQIVGTTPNNNPLLWSRLLPAFGRISKGQSGWFRMGATNVSPTGTTDGVAFGFGGTNTTTGKVLRTGTGTNATVSQVSALVTGTLNAQPVTPYVAADGRTLYLDPNSFVGSNDIYVRNPSLLRFFELEVDGVKHIVASASISDGTIAVVVAGSGTPLAGAGAGDSYTLRPRFFEVQTDGTLNRLPSTADITIEFQAAPATILGTPDEAGASAWVKDVTLLNSLPGNNGLRFVRFRVAFDIGADGTDLSATTPIPALQFLRLPFRF
jgi:hypothetical protein